MPAVTVRSSPKGLPIATTASPTSTRVESASVSGVSALRVGVDLEQGDVGRRIAADERRLERVVVREPDLDRGGAVDDVVVRDDVSFLVDARSRSRAPARTAGTGRRRVGRAERRGDLDDAGATAPVDLVHGQGAAAGRRGCGASARGGGPLDDGRRRRWSKAPTAAAPPRATPPPRTAAVTRRASGFQAEPPPPPGEGAGEGVGGDKGVSSDPRTRYRRGLVNAELVGVKQVLWGASELLRGSTAASDAQETCSGTGSSA